MSSVALQARLVNVAQWLENGCDPSKAADELRLIAHSFAVSAPKNTQTFEERRKDVERTRAGDVWADRKSGKEVLVVRATGLHLQLRHENGRVTSKWGLYLAGTHYLKARAAQREGQIFVNELSDEPSP